MKTQIPQLTALLLGGWLLAACSAAPPAPVAETLRPVAFPSPTLPLPPTETAAPSPSTPLPATPPTAVAVAPTDTPIPTDVPTVAPPSPYKDFGPAPEIDTDVWLNSDSPLRLAELRGQVVLIDFWTYG